MARVPTSNDPLQPAPVTPQYQSDAGASSDAFGSLQAQSLQKAAEPLNKLATNLGEEAISQATKRDAVARARDLGIFGTQATNALYTAQTEQDMTDPGTIGKFTKQLDDLQQQTLANHTGGPDSKQALAARIELKRSEVLGSANAIASTAQETLVKQTVGTALQPITASVYSNPGGIEDAMKRADGVIADMMPAMGTVKAQAATNSARQEVIKSAISGMLDRGQVEEARKATDQYAGLLTPDTQRYFQSHITIAQVAADKAKNASNALVAQATQVLGRPPTQAEGKVLLGLVKPEDPNSVGAAPTPSETIAAFEKATGKPATDEQKAIAFGLAKPGVSGSGTGADFGKGAYGRSMAILNDGMDAFAHGLMTPDEERKFQVAATIAQQPIQKMNPDTQVLETVTRPLPPQVVEAFRMRGIPLPVANGPTLAGQGGPVSGATPALQPAAAQPAAGGAPAAAGDTAAASPTSPAAAGGQTFWQLNQKGLVTGPVAALGEAEHQVTVGGASLPGSEMTQARHLVETQEHQFLQALHNNPRYPVAEMKLIEKDIGLSPSIFVGQDAYQDRLIAVDDALAQRQAQADKRGSDMSLGKDDRMAARRVSSLIHDLRENMGVPPKVSPAEADKLPSGTQYRSAKTGKLFTKN